MGDLGRQIGERAQADARKCPGCGERPHPALSCTEARRVRAEQPVQARDNDNGLWWLHECGWIRSFPDRPIDRNGWCPSCSKTGPWRPLLVAAPDGDRAPKPPADTSWLRTTDGDHMPEKQCGREDTHGGHVWQGGTVDFWCDGFTGRAGVQQSQFDLMAQVREALDVVSDAEVVPEIKAIRELLDELRDQRDEARAEAEDWKRRFHEEAARGDAAAQQLLAARARASRHLATIAASENACALEEARAELAEARVDVERYRRLLKTQAENFAAATPAPDGPIVYRLPEVDPRTVALIGESRWVRAESDRNAWVREDQARPRTLYALASVFLHEPEGVTAELAPEPEPQPRTAAEVWRGLHPDDRMGIAFLPTELAEALDREAGL